MTRAAAGLAVVLALTPHALLAQSARGLAARRPGAARDVRRRAALLRRPPRLHGVQERQAGATVLGDAHPGAGQRRRGHASSRRLVAAVVTRRIAPRVHRPHRRGDRAGGGRRRRQRRPPPGRDRRHQSSAAVVGRVGGVGARRAVDRLRVGDTGPARPTPTATRWSSTAISTSRTPVRAARGPTTTGACTCSSSTSATKTVRQLTEGTYYEHSIDWSPKGNEILFVSNREPDPDRVVQLRRLRGRRREPRGAPADHHQGGRVHAPVVTRRRGDRRISGPPATSPRRRRRWRTRTSGRCTPTAAAASRSAAASTTARARRTGRPTASRSTSRCRSAARCA